ncbi:prpF [Symbiodinium necroappetens]|uniref:PrpF protein n=1 Tax=Symbiodinium necroappetens TaxID=1628268 RepID=A0A812KIN9_9DINO|nr:prpF [Symbiodinium necroappetens]
MPSHGAKKRKTPKSKKRQAVSEDPPEKTEAKAARKKAKASHTGEGALKPKYRQAKEEDAVVEVLCFSCRRASDASVQLSVTNFFKKAAAAAPVPTPQVIDLDAPPSVDPSVCSRCRKPLRHKLPTYKKSADAMQGVGELPQLQRLRAYRRIAEKQGVPFLISEKSACALMRGPCFGCGVPAPQRGHGLTRLRFWPAGVAKPDRGGFMGPYAEANVAPACTMCNMMKGHRRISGFVECCRHIATKHTEGENFGEYPHRFRDNVSRRSRSCYISQSSTHTKTHSLTNEQFNAIVSGPCFYCGKEPRKPKTNGPHDRGHFNGLDRLDSENRVYAKETTVACCGDCNIMKYRWGLQEFLEHCRSVALFHRNKEFADEAALEEAERREFDEEVAIESGEAEEDVGETEDDDCDSDQEKINVNTKTLLYLVRDAVAVGSQLLCQDGIRIPRIIHQLWMSPQQPGVTFQDREPERPDIVEAIRQWRVAALRDSPKPWQHQVWNRSSVRSVLDRYPHLADGFERLARWPERQKDFFMYAVLGIVGGFFIDADVMPLQLPSAWFEEACRADVAGSSAKIQLMVGLECRGSAKEAEAWRWSGRLQLTAWALAAAPGHPVMLRALTRYLETPGPAIGFSALAHYQHSVAMGPGLLTLLVDEWIQENSPNGGGLKAMASVLGFSAASVSSDTVVTAGAVRTVYSSETITSDEETAPAGPCNESENALVQHLFMGAWKPAEGPWALDEDESRRRRRRFDGPTEFIDWRGPAFAKLLGSMRALRAAWIRGGTSKGLFFREADLPPPGNARDQLILAALGSPDPSGLQLNGLGGGISSTSKVVILSTSQRDGYDVNYLFGQVEIKERLINWEGSCGNLSAGVGLFALAEHLVKPAFDGPSQLVRVWQQNQGYGMNVHVPKGVDAPIPEAETEEEVSLLSLAGIPGREPAVYVELLEPHGAKPLLPTGEPITVLQLEDGSQVEATLVTAGNPTIFVPADVVGLRGSELPSEMDYSRILPVVDRLRAQAAPLFGIEVSDQPRVSFVAQPGCYMSTAGDAVDENAMDLLARISTPGRIHHAFTGTGSIAIACAAQVEKSIPWRCIPENRRRALLRVGHPGGVMEVKADVRHSADRGWHAVGAGFERTSRYLMRGDVFIPRPGRAP